MTNSHNNRMQPDFGELALASAADAKRYVAFTSGDTRKNLALCLWIALSAIREQGKNIASH